MQRDNIMEGSHLEFAAAESTALDADEPWLRWLKAAEQASGIADLDGDEHIDGHSLDSAYDAWRQGDTPEDYANRVALARASIGKQA